MASLSGQLALISGAGRGIGRATALALAERGADVIVLARTLAQLDETAELVRARGRRCRVVQADVSDWDQIASADFGPVDVLVNNAGVHGEFGMTWELESGPYARTLMVNVLGPLHLIHAVVPGMVERHRGVVINVSSGTARQRSIARSAYATSKAALDHLSTIVADEARPFGVRVHSFHPGLVDTELQAELRSSPGLPRALLEEFRARERNGQLQPPDAPARAIAWLASADGAAWPDVLFDWRDPATRQRAGLA